MAVKAKKAAAEIGEAAVAATPNVTFPTFNYDEFAELGRDNFSAVIKANEALTEGLEAIGKEIMTYAKTSFESASQTAAALLGAKTFEDVVQLQSDLAKSTIETLLERSAKLSELSLSVANEAFAPLNGRFEATVAKLTKPLAA